MFSRLNEAVPLNAAEKRNAIGGPMTKLINRISSHPFFSQNVSFTNKRYQYKETAARILFIEYNLFNHKLIDTKKVYLDNFVKYYKKNPKTDTNKIETEVIEILNRLSELFDPEDSLLKSNSSIPIYYLLMRSAQKQKKTSYITRQRLLEFREKLDNNQIIAEDDISKADFDLFQYDRLSIQGTNDASSIRERTRIITKFFGVRSILE